LERTPFIIDKQGAVRWKKIYPGGERPDVDEVLKSYRPDKYSGFLEVQTPNQADLQLYSP